MNWQPIKYYDAMAKKPRHCVFYVEAQKSGNGHPSNNLPAVISLDRIYGRRNVTKFIELPDPEA